MDKCGRWQFTPVILGYYEEIPIYSPQSKQTCLGILGKVEPRKCICGGDVTKCDFYPEKRKEGKMNTAEMWLKARENGKTYKLADVTRIVYYRDGKGLFDAKGYYVSIDHWCGIDSFMSEQWEEATPVLTKSEAEAKFSIKIVGV